MGHQAYEADMLPNEPQQVVLLIKQLRMLVTATLKLITDLKKSIRP
jgi:hypothetical protein